LLPRPRMQNAWTPVVLALIVLIFGCSMVPVPDTADVPLRLSVAVGDTVRVLTKYGDRPTFKVTDVTETALIGRNHSIFYDDMAFVEKWSGPSAQSTVVVVLLLVGGAVLVEEMRGMGAGIPDVQQP
jgi:hypothetical protein